MRHSALSVLFLFAAATSGCDDDPQPSRSCTSDGDCKSGLRCDTTASSCLTACSFGRGDNCADGFHCTTLGTCELDVALTGLCSFSEQCAGGLQCENGVCCAEGGECCANNDHCTGALQGNLCDVTKAECSTYCEGEGHDDCGSGFHCDGAVCRRDETAGGVCNEDTDCATGNHCQNGLCCGAGLTCCNRDGFCEGEGTGARCNMTEFACRATCASDADCVADKHCSAGACVGDAAVGAACTTDGECAPGLHCGGGICCGLGKVCCASDATCASAGSTYACDVETSACRTSCDDGDNSACRTGNTCQFGICAGAPPAGGFCRTEDECSSDGDWCRNGVCCQAGEDCCYSNADCGTCEKCDQGSGTCVLQAATEDLKNECESRSGNCEEDLCSGTADRCAFKREDSDCGTCRTCNAEGSCETNSTDHGDCGTCSKCASGSCVVQSNTEDLKQECATYTCTERLYGMSGGACSTFATATAANTGLCTGSGACPTVAASCTDVGGPTSPSTTCDGVAACTVCPTGALASAYNDATEQCSFAPFAQLGCSAGLGCYGSPAACTDLPASCKAIKTAIPTAPSGEYQIDPDGASGSIAAYRVYCDMTTSGGGWTLILKAGPSSGYWRHLSSWWNTATTLNTTSTNMLEEDAKFASFNNVPFSQILIGMTDDGTTRYLSASVTARGSMREATALRDVTPTSVGREGWKGLMEDGALQPFCDREGINAFNSYGYNSGYYTTDNTGPTPLQYWYPYTSGHGAVRIGMITNENGEGDCSSSDSWLGVGGGDAWACGIDETNAVGNEVRCGGQGDDRSTRAFGYVFVK